MTCIFRIVRFDPGEDVMLEGFVGKDTKETYDRADARLEYWWNKYPNAVIDIVRTA